MVMVLKDDDGGDGDGDGDGNLAMRQGRGTDHCNRPCVI